MSDPGLDAIHDLLGFRVIADALVPRRVVLMHPDDARAVWAMGYGLEENELAEFQGWLTEERADRIVKLSRAFQDREEKNDAD